MPRRRPATSGYERIAQAEEEEEDDEDNYSADAQSENNTTYTPTSNIHPSHTTSQYAPIQHKRHDSRAYASGTASPARRRSGARRQRSNSGVDIKAINARLERWADEIASRLRIRRVKGKTYAEEQLEIHHSVFQAPDWIRPISAEELAASAVEADENDSHGHRPVPDKHMTKEEFDSLVESVQLAIEQGVHPKLISQGSSGSYFARTPSGKVVGVFKPKDEEPYASRNPKWTKWIHRNLFPFFFGRACLIPNLSYVSEAAAHVLDVQLKTNLVPYTDVVSLSSKAFHYDFWDRRAFYRRKKRLPEKAGSFQVFLKGYKDANIFLKEHPWPDQTDDSLQFGNRRRKKRRPWRETCSTGRSGSGHGDNYEEVDDGGSQMADSSRGYSEEGSRQRGFWTESTQETFREELEKLVILDYIMRNTDRGLDNWMIKVWEQKQEAYLAAKNSHTFSGDTTTAAPADGESDKRQDTLNPTSRSSTPRMPYSPPSVTIGAIDNSLSWPWKHPDAWRSYPFGWLFLPVSLIGQPFSEKTRRHFLPLLTSKAWWSETQTALRDCFSIDVDFKERMFARQLAVMKGQAWNVVETLKTPDHGPLELTRRARALVWDDLVDVPVAVRLNDSTDVQNSQHHPSHRKLYSSQGQNGGGEGKNAAANFEESGMDISNVRSSASTAFSSQHYDLLGIPSPAADTTKADNPFNTSRHTSTQDDCISSEDPTDSLSPASARILADGSRRNEQRLNGSGRPGMPNGYGTSIGNLRMSLDERKLWRSPERSSKRKQQREQRVRRFSFGAGGNMAGPDGAMSLNDHYGEEGDLGFAAVEDRSGNRRKVIIERLEIVKSKGPVFTWC